MISPVYFRDTDGILLFCDLTNRESFTRDLLKYKEDIEKRSEISKVPMVVVGTKCDLIDKIVVKRAEIDEVVKLWGIHYIEVSAKADVNVKEAVLTLLKLVPLPCEVPQVFPTIPQHQSFLSWLWSFFSW
jgi:GTPase KRas protein